MATIVYIYSCYLPGWEVRTSIVKSCDRGLEYLGVLLRKIWFAWRHCPGVIPYKKRRVCSSEIIKRAAKKYQHILCCGHELICFQPKEIWFLKQNIYYLRLIIWLAPWEGKMNQIARCDWLSEQAILPARDYPLSPARKLSPKSFIDQDATVDQYWPCSFLRVHKHAKKELGQYQAILTSHLVNNPYMATRWNYACAGAWPLSRNDVIAENKMAPLLQYFVLMAIIVSIECRKDVFKCSLCGKNLSNLKAERRKFRAVSDDLFACFGPLEEASPHEPGKKVLCGTCRRALADFKRTGKLFFHVSKNAISQQSVTICVS